MTDLPFAFDGPVTLVGGGPLSHAMLEAAMAIAPVLVAADGAADRLAELGREPTAVIGDMDSIADIARWRAGPAPILDLPEQDSTDFEKCLYATSAAYYLAVGFSGGRIDHTLAVFHAMLRYPEKPVFLVGEVEAMALLPPARRVHLALGEGAAVSLFPLLGVRGVHSRGLRWPIDGLEMAPGKRIATSNRASTATVEIEVDGPGALLLVQRRQLRALVEGILAAREG